MRFLLIFLFTGVLVANSLEDSAAALAQAVLAHLMPDEIANVTWRDGATNELKSAFARALQRRIRNPKQVEVHAYLSENFKGPLLIAEIVRENGNVVEMVGASRERGGNSPLTLNLSLIWEHEFQILDLAFLNDQMLVLDTSGLETYTRQDGQWHLIQVGGYPVGNGVSIGPNPWARDLRGHIDVTKNPFVVYWPGKACSNSVCQPGGMFTVGRNTLSEEGWPAHYTHVELAGEHLLAEVDGRTHVYDSGRMPTGAFEGWGSDFAVISSNCGGQKVLASEAASDAVALYGIVNHQPIQMSDVVALPGPITAIWPQGSRAIVTAKNSKTGRYEAYSASMDCRN